MWGGLSNAALTCMSGLGPLSIDIARLLCSSPELGARLAHKVRRTWPRLQGMRNLCLGQEVWILGFIAPAALSWFNFCFAACGLEVSVQTKGNGKVVAPRRRGGFRLSVAGPRHVK